MRDELGDLLRVVVWRGHQTPANAPKVNCFKVVFEVNVEDPAFADVLSGVAHDTTLATSNEPMDVSARAIVAFQKAEDVLLQFEKRNPRGANTSAAATFLWDCEFFVSCTRSKPIGNVDKSPPIISAKRESDLSKVGKGL